ncbi:MAG: PilZ domain-containing protein [Treponema sp.]|jgi:hypothetical protein|nr:PilZ domain-containing protein [Treponema sp.]
MSILMNLMMFPLVSLGDMKMGGGAKSASSASGQYFVLGVGIVVIILIIINVLRNKSKPGVGGKHAPAAGPRAFSGFTLHRITSDMGLDREQVKMLDYVMKSGGISDPERFLNSPALLDKHFKRAYKLIERTSAGEEDLNERLAVLFSTRNIIDANAKGNIATSSRQIAEKTPAVLTIDNANYQTQVISARGDTLVVEKPRRSAGGILQLQRGRKANLALSTDSSKAYAVETQIVGTTDTPYGPALQLAHSKQIKKLFNRSFRRRQKAIETGFYFVQVDEKTKKMTVDKRRYTGNIQDISVGGCSMKVTIQVIPKQRLKLEFIDDDDTIVAALGEVLRISRSGMGTIIHIKFLKVPRRSLNSINAMVYDYEN